MSIRKHTSYNIVGAVLPLIIAIATVPLYLQAVGEARYGVLAIAWLLLGYFGVFDLGLGVAAGQRIAALATSGVEQRAQVFWTALVMNAGLGAVGGIMLWPVALYTAQRIGMAAPLRAEFIESVAWLVVAVPFATVSGVLIGALQGRSQFLELNLISILSSAIAQILPLVVALILGPELPRLIASVLLGRALAVAVMFWRCQVHVTPKVPMRLSRATARHLLRFGGWVTVSSVLSPLMVVIDRFAIGVTMGAQAVAHYTVSFQVTERFVLLPAAVSSALFPRIASTTAEQRGNLVPESFQTLLCAMTPAAVAAVLLVEPFIGWWITPAFAAQAGKPAQLLTVAFWLNSCAQIPFSQLRATGRPDLIAKCHLGELLPYLALLYVALLWGGITGAAIAFLVRVGADCFLLMVFSGLVRDVGVSLLKHLAVLVSTLALGLFIEVGTAVWWIGSASLLLWSMILSWTSSPERLRREVFARLKRCP